MTSLIWAVCMAIDLIKEQDLRTNTPPRWCNINSLDETGLAFAFGTGPVLPTGQDLGIGLPLIGEVSAVVAVAPRQYRPQAFQRDFAPTTQDPADDAPTDALDSQPKSCLSLSASYKGPHFSAFQGLPVLLLGLFRAQPEQRKRGHCRIF